MVVIVGGGAIGEAIRARTRAIVINSKDFTEIVGELSVINESTPIQTIIVTSGFLEKHRVGEFDETVVSKTISANFSIPLLVADYSVRNFPTTNLVFFSSSVVFEAREGYSVYSASKTALEIFLRTILVESPNTNIKIIRNARTDTKLRWDNYSKTDNNLENLLTPDDVAKATIQFLNNKGIVLEIYKRNNELKTDIWETI